MPDSDTVLELEKFFATFLTDPNQRRLMGERAKQLVIQNRGATERTLESLKQLLAGPGGARTAESQGEKPMKAANSFILPPFSALYSIATRLRLAAYRRRLFSVSKLDAPVISVGNITTGGTGKTPLVEWICRVLAEEGKRVCVLTRGYRRQNPNEQVVVSDGHRILADVAAAGDEPLLLARNLLGIAAVVCNSNRSEAGRWAIKNLQSEVFVLDDGFQHLQLARDLNIVTIDATNPWGGGLLPMVICGSPSQVWRAPIASS